MKKQSPNMKAVLKSKRHCNQEMAALHFVAFAMTSYLIYDLMIY